MTYTPYTHPPQHAVELKKAGKSTSKEVRPLQVLRYYWYFLNFHPFVQRLLRIPRLLPKMRRS
jgi:hypothetical protein